MRKSIKNASRRKAIRGGGRSESPRKVGLREVLVNARASLREVVVSSGLQVLAAMLEEDRERLCGPRSQRSEERGAYRHGHDEAPVVLGGRKVRVSKPRVRSVDEQEVELPTWRQMTEEDPLEARAVEQMLVGVSTRGYARSLEPLPEEMESVGVSRSSVSRRFVARTAREVEVFLGRELEGIDFPVVMVDGTELGEHVLVTALGIDSTGKKQVLGVREGSTENEQLCVELLRSLVERGLVAERARLFVIDGGKGIRKAIRGVFESWALVQRCQVHKMRNVVEHLPESKRTWARSELRRAWRSESAAAATRKLRGLAKLLDSQHPGAAASVREGLEETLTVLELGVPSRLSETLRSTNPIENLQGLLKQVAHKVRRWRSGSMALRWGVTSMMEAERRFRRVKGYRELPQLLAALETKTASRKVA